MDEPRVYCTEGSKSERERQIHINAWVWNLERWYWWTYLQGSSGDAERENRFVDTVWEEEGGTNWKNSMEIYITICKIDGGNLLCNIGNSTQCSVTTWSCGMGTEVGRRFKEGTYVYQWLSHVDIWQKPAQYYTGNICNKIFLMYLVWCSSFFNDYQYCISFSITLHFNAFESSFKEHFL